MILKILPAAAAALVLGGCTLADVTVPPSEDRLVVEAVLRTDFTQQTVLLHRTVQDQASRKEPGASVEVTGPNGLRVTFVESTEACYAIDPGYDASEVAVEASCYVSPRALGRWVTPGQAYDLTVRTARGEEALGRTVVPGTFSVRGIRTTNRADVREPTCTLPPQTPLNLSWTPAPGAWGYLAPLNIFGLRNAFPPEYGPPDPLELVGVSVSAADTTLVLPGEFGVFDRFDYNQDLLRVLQAGLPEGTSARVAIAAADRNYINGVRGGNFNPSGQVRISSIVGDGVGVFGSLTTLRFAIDAIRANNTSRCGNLQP
ncbi:DUF4249 family protein [Longimicrobium sp.]|uniref:DUF4249 family protein n=1 Tax=Longimicrobium sp. TaxID=2029185 RepID=UPI002E31DFB3|nr:DUF4249 family protein [Longimicrobium sp.]HEX6040448.1 DUF4249 family protein [Longimicrobium sp.]